MSTEGTARVLRGGNVPCEIVGKVGAVSYTHLVVTVSVMTRNARNANALGAVVNFMSDEFELQDSTCLLYTSRCV